MMNQLVKEFPEQLKEAIEIGKGIDIKPYPNEIRNVLVAGLGGSGIGGDYVGSFILDECSVPFSVSKGYSIPHYVNENTLVIISSYSGNTEETLNAFDQALDQGAMIFCIASGGKIIEKAKKEGFNHVQVPSGKPSPRACLGYSIVQQIYFLNKIGLIDDSLLVDLDRAVSLLDQEQEDIKARASKIASFLFGKTPVIYASDRMEPVAIRFRQQINENAKCLSWHHVIPEMNHNELVGWRDKKDDLAVIFLRNKDDFYRNQVRMDINKEIISQYTPTVIEIFSKGNSLLERAFYFTHLVDYVSVFLADLREMDAIEVDVIDFLKGELAKV